MLVTDSLLGWIMQYARTKSEQLNEPLEKQIQE